MEKFRNILVIIGGINFLLFGLYHISFWFFPEWNSELTKLTELIGNMIQMLNIGLSVFLLAFGFIMLFYRRAILNSALGRVLLISFSLFWLARLVSEFAFPGGSITMGFILFLLVLVYLIPAIKK
jgi:nitrate reductase gamma subunit